MIEKQVWDPMLGARRRGGERWGAVSSKNICAIRSARPTGWDVGPEGIGGYGRRRTTKEGG